MTRFSGPIEQQTHLPRQVASYLMREISSGRLKPGAQVPSEHCLAQRLSVSRNVVREAVAQLRADGVVMARQGVGAFVQAPERRSAIRFDEEALQSRSSMQRLFELRGILETDAAGLAATRRDDDNLRRMEAALDRMKGGERWEDGSIEADLVFHREIARATDNDHIYSFVCFICEQIRRSIHIARLTNPLRQLVEINIAEHVGIFEALKAEDAKAARSAMRAHIRGASERVGARSGGGEAIREG